MVNLDNPTNWIGIAALALVALREALLLAAGFYKKRRNGLSGEKSVEFWAKESRELVERALDDKLRPVQRSLDELLNRNRRR